MSSKPLFIESSPVLSEDYNSTLSKALKRLNKDYDSEGGAREALLPERLERAYVLACNAIAKAESLPEGSWARWFSLFRCDRAISNLNDELEESRLRFNAWAYAHPDTDLTIWSPEERRFLKRLREEALAQAELERLQKMANCQGCNRQRKTFVSRGVSTEQSSSGAPPPYDS